MTIYKKDQWTRVAEGPILSDATFSTELEQGAYYYEVINYSPVVDILGTSGYRYLLQKGTFTIGDNTDVRKITASDLQIVVANDELLIKGIKENTSIRLTDVTGRIIINTTANSLSKEVSLPAKGVYILTTNSVSEGSHSIKILSH